MTFSLSIGSVLRTYLVSHLGLNCANKNKTAETVSGAGIMNDFGFNTGTTGYDTEDRLTNWNRTDGNREQAWNLSAVGDWNQLTDGGQTTSYANNAAHETVTAGSVAITYDANGNRLNSSAGTVYSWDLDNRLVAAGNHSFEYDALGRRVVVSIDNETSVMVCPDGQLIAVYALAATTSAPAKTFVYGSYVDEPLMQVSGREKLYFSRNQQYSITGATNAAGQIVERYAYTAYGETIILSPAGTPRATSSVGNPFTYTGRHNHAEVGLMYFRARCYDPETGEFISRDPLEYVDGMSLYRGYFVPGATDPTGLKLELLPNGGDTDIYKDDVSGKCYTRQFANNKWYFKVVPCPEPICPDEVDCEEDFEVCMDAAESGKENCFARGVAYCSVICSIRFVGQNAAITQCVAACGTAYVWACNTQWRWDRTTCRENKRACEQAEE